MQVVRPYKPNEAVAQILALEQREDRYDEDSDWERRRWEQADGQASGEGMQPRHLKDVGEHPPVLGYPSGCSSENTVRLADLIAPLLADSPDHAVQAMPLPVKAAEAADTWRQASARLRQRCAVFMALPDDVRDSPTRSLEFFRRVGAGETPLSQAEQVYAAYKIRKPEVRRLIERIHNNVTAALTPAQIIQAAIRMAYTQADPQIGWAPGFDAAIKALAAKDGIQGEEDW